MTRRFFLAVILACLISNTAKAQEFESDQKFAIDLAEVSRVLDELDPARRGEAAWDTTGKFDFDHVAIGNLHHKIPNFVRYDFKRVKTTVEYGRNSVLVIRHSPIQLLTFYERTGGDLIEYIPRQLDQPGIKLDIVPFDQYVERLRVSTLRSVWREAVVDAISAQVGRTSVPTRGMTINIPLPMPRQLESIFGPSDKTHINISGRESITFAGESRRVDPFLGYEGQEKQSLFPTLDMKQELDVSLKGTIGDKVFIEVNHASQSVGDDANHVNVHYEGYEEDVIQRVELGNTSLSLPGQRLIGGFSSGGNKGLFGIKVLAKLGPTDITFIASKEQGQSSSASFSPTAGGLGREEERVIRDVDFVKNKYYYLDTPYPDPGSGIYSLVASDSAAFDVYRSATKQEKGEGGTVVGWAFIDESGIGTGLANAISALNTPGAPEPPNFHEKDWVLLEPEKDYEFFLDVESRAYVGIVMHQSLQNDQALAIRYTAVDGGGNLWPVGGSFASTSYGTSVLSVDSVTINPENNPSETLRVRVNNTPGSEGAQDNPLVLELIKYPEEIRGPNAGAFGFTWWLMRRNFYNLGLQNIDPATLEVTIEDNFDNRLDPTVPVGASVPYLQIFGLDRFNQNAGPFPDGLIDIRDEVIDLSSGVLQFPDPRAFAPHPANVAAWTDSAFSFAVPTDSTDYSYQYARSELLYDAYLSDPSEFHQYLIRVRAVSAATTFRLDAFNIIENSETITVGSTRLTRGTDYSIDYLTGEIVLADHVEISPTSAVRIDYDFTPFGGSTSSSLVGVSAVSRIGEQGTFGTTWLYESKSVDTDRPRLGEEPTRTVVGGANTSFQVLVPRLTDLINKLPQVDTDAQSSISFQGEVAASFPNPNTKGESFVDDFEGTEDSDRISMLRTFWRPATLPLNALAAADSVDRRHDFIWYNVDGAFAPKKRDFNPKLDERENDIVTALDIQVGNRVGIDDAAWAGVMTGFGHGGLDLSRGQFLEVWVNDFHQDIADRRGILHIDLGTIDEDFFDPDANIKNDEDVLQDGFVIATDDIGLNMIDDEDELDLGDDPEADNWSIKRTNGRYTKINKTENNQRYDTEDLDDNGLFNQTNSYFSYAIDLASVPEEDISADYSDPDIYRAGHEKDAWRLYRIRLSDSTVVTDSGEPRLDQVRHMRIWFEKINDVVGTDVGIVNANGEPLDLNDRIQITGLKVLGNRWLTDGVRDLNDVSVDSTGTEFAVSVISNKTDPSAYVPGPHVNEENGIFEKESSLRLSFTDLDGESQLRIKRQYTGNGLNFGQYRDLNLWVFTRSAAEAMSIMNDSLEYYFRIATSPDNYYEFVLPLENKFFDPSGWSRILFKLTDLTDLKFATLDAEGVAHGHARDLAEPARRYPVRMVGNPSLFRVLFLYAGIRNKHLPGQLRSGEVWVNDIFLGDVRADPDFAFRASTGINIGGGILSMNASWDRTGPDFHGLRAKKGSGAWVNNVSVNGKTNLKYYLPLAGFSIPISVGLTRAQSLPKFTPSSDTEITSPAIRDSLRTERITQSISTSLTRPNSGNPFLKYTVGKISNGVSYSISKLREPARRDTTRTIGGSLGYELTWGANKDIKLFRGYKIRYLPNSISIKNTGRSTKTRSYRFQNGQFVKQPFRYTATTESNGRAVYKPISNMSANFSATLNRNLGLRREWHGVNIGREVSRRHALRVGWTPNLPIVRNFEPSLDVSTGYNENSDPNIRLAGQRWAANASATRNASLKMKFDVAHQFARVFKLFGWEVKRDKRKGWGDRYNEPRARPGSGRVPPPSPADTTGGLVRPAVADSMILTRPDSVATETGTPFDPFKKLAGILLDVRKVNANFSHREGSNYSRLPDRPQWAYQFGLDNSSGVLGADGEIIDQPEKLTTTLGMNFDTGVALTEDIGITARYTKNISDSELRGRTHRSTASSFPDLGMQWQGIGKVGFLDKMLTSSSATVDFKRTTSESGPLNEDPDTKRSSIQTGPSFTLGWKNDISSKFSVSYRGENSDTRGARSERTTFSVSMDLGKIFRTGGGFKIPIPFLSKQFKWKSQLDGKLGATYSRSGGNRYSVGSDRALPIPATSSIRVSPTFAYNFSQTLNGRAFVNYTRVHSDATGQTTTVIRVGVNVVFTF